MWLASYGAAESSQSYWSTQLRSLIQPGFEPGANLVSSCPSGTSLFETILNPHSTKLRRKMPSPRLKCRNSAISSTVAAIEMLQFTGDFRPIHRWRNRGAEYGWRTKWDSNWRYGFPHTRFPSVRLKPLGHLSG